MPQKEQKRRMPLWKRVLLGFGIVLAILLVVLVFMVILFVLNGGLFGPYPMF